MKVKEIKGLLGEVQPQKGLGQHFLIDESVLHPMITAAALEPGDTVLEIGPGLGILTRALAEHAGQVIAVELDATMMAILRERLAGYDNIQLIQSDILEIDPLELVGSSPYKVIANLPYYITSAVLRHLLEAQHRPEVIVVMVQLEVAERIRAQPGHMSMLSVSVQFYGRPQIVTRVHAGAFWPRPNVDSAVLKIDVYGAPTIEVEDIEWYFRVVRAGFGQKRKQLKNSLAAGLHRSREETEAALMAAGIDPSRRAETLSIEEWGSLAHALRP